MAIHKLRHNHGRVGGPNKQKSHHILPLVVFHSPDKHLPSTHDMPDVTGSCGEKPF